ncbi:hypothetical protein C490_02046, partial [Natronobacterium gregoryi SP2]
EASQKISSHSISERFNFDASYCGNQGEKRSNTLSKRRYEINKVLHKSVGHRASAVSRFNSLVLTVEVYAVMRFTRANLTNMSVDEIHKFHLEQLHDSYQ